MSKTIATRLSELEALQGISPAGALVWLAEDGKSYHWHGHEGTFSLDEIEAQIKPNGHILIWDLTTAHTAGNMSPPDWMPK